MRTLQATLLAALLATPFAFAAHGGTAEGRCDADGQPALGLVEITAGKAGYTYYVDDRNWATGNGVWLYEEANGVWHDKPPGVYHGDIVSHDLHRGGSWNLMPTQPEPCTDFGDWDPDRILNS